MRRSYRRAAPRLMNVTNCAAVNTVGNVTNIDTAGTDVSTWDSFAWTGYAFGYYSTTSGSASYFPACAHKLGFLLKDSVGRVYAVFLSPGQQFSLRGKAIVSIACIGPNANQTSSPQLLNKVYVAYII